MKNLFLTLFLFSIANATQGGDALFDGAKEDGNPESQGWSAEGGIETSSQPKPKDGFFHIETAENTKDQDALRYTRADLPDLGDNFFWQARIAMIEGSRAITLSFEHPKWYDQIQVLPGNRTVHVRVQPDATGEVWMRVDCPEVNKDEPHTFRMEHHGARFDFLIDGKKFASGLSTYAGGRGRALMMAYPSGPTRVNWYAYECGPLVSESRPVDQPAGK